MTWNWQQPDWPRLHWNSAGLAHAEERFLLEAGVFIGAAKHLSEADRNSLTVEIMSAEALTTSEIEGEILNRASVQSSIRKELGLSSDNRRVRPAERGVAAMMADLYRHFADPLREGMLHGWHKSIMQGNENVGESGRYRTGEEPMQIVSGAIYAPRVHFEAPPSSRVQREMKRFITWFNRSAPESEHSIPALARAGAAHLYFVSIHPYEDGNGRIARALAEKALAQGLGQPSLIALAATILARRKAYYRSLEASNQRNEITGWLEWFAETAIEAQRRATESVQFFIEKARLLDGLRNQLNPRQEKALLRVLREGPSGFRGGLSASNYMRITGASPATATRDLAGMVEKGALVRTGELRHARYFAPIAGTHDPKR